MTEKPRDLESTPIIETDNAGREKTWLQINSENKCSCNGCVCQTTNP
jgi:hypothetical protein